MRNLHEAKEERIRLRCNRRENIAIRELLQAQILSDKQDLLPMSIRTQNLCTLPNDEHAEVCVKQAEQILCIRDDISRRVRISGECADLDTREK